MKVFFTCKNKAVEGKDNIDAIDIWTPKFSISIRTSGIRMTSNLTHNEIIDRNFDLSEEKIKENHITELDDGTKIIDYREKVEDNKDV